MTVAELVAKVRGRTQTDTTTYPNADILVDINNAVTKLSIYVGKKNEDLLGMVGYQTLEVNKREYALPKALKRLERVFVKFDGTTWIELGEIDSAIHYVPANESEIVAHYSNTLGNACFTNYRNHLQLYSGSIDTEVSSGIMVEYITSKYNTITDATSTTDLASSLVPSSGYPGIQPEFHPILIPMTSREYKLNSNMGTLLTDDEQLAVINNELEQTVNAVIVPRNNNRNFKYLGTNRMNCGYYGFEL